MKLFKSDKGKVIKVTIILSAVFILLGVSYSFGMQHYYKLDFSTGLVTATTLNVRSGPGVTYKVVATAKQNEYIRVFAGVGDWYIVQIEGDYIGAVNKKYVKPIYPGANVKSNYNGNSSESDLSGSGNASTMNSNEEEVLKLINEQRKKNGLSDLKVDNEVQRVARIKAQDMVDKNYFSHTSPTYGSPFDMLKSFKVTYKTAGENIAGNSTNAGAVNAWMNSPGHKANILNSSFNYTGIGVVSSSTYGKVYVQMFIGK